MNEVKFKEEMKIFQDKLQERVNDISSQLKQVLSEKENNDLEERLIALKNIGVGFKKIGEDVIGEDLNDKE